MCANTNKKAKKKLEMGKQFSWFDISPPELRKYLGMLLFMSVCKLPKLSDLSVKTEVCSNQFKFARVIQRRMPSSSRKGGWRSMTPFKWSALSSL